MNSDRIGWRGKGGGDRRHGKMRVRVGKGRGEQGGGERENNRNTGTRQEGRRWRNRSSR